MTECDEADGWRRSATGHADEVDRPRVTESELDLTVLDDTALATLGQAVDAELRRRAVEGGDLDAIVEEGFRRGFDAKGHPGPPYLEGRILVCPGGKVSSSALSHQCRFVAVGDGWVWEHPDVLCDEIRPRGRFSSASITLLVARDGLELESVTSKARGGAHARMHSEGYRVVGDTLVGTGRRGAPAREHGR